jgi:hypothetical protein
MSVEDSKSKKSAELAVESTTAPVLEDARWTTTRLELWSYYLYYIGNSGLSGYRRYRFQDGRSLNKTPASILVPPSFRTCCSWLAMTPLCLHSVRLAGTTDAFSLILGGSATVRPFSPAFIICSRFPSQFDRPSEFRPYFHSLWFS